MNLINIAANLLKSIRRRPQLFVFLTLIIWSSLMTRNAFRVEEKLANNNARQLDSTASASFSKVAYCSTHRGASGHWVLDWDEYAPTAQYETIGSMPKAVLANNAYQPSQEEPFRRATAYRWQDRNVECPVSRIMADGLDGFCRSAQTLNIDRVWVAGDSLSEGFSHSFRSQLGFTKEAYLKKLLHPFVFNCTNAETGGIFPIEHRFDRIDENFTLGLFHDKNSLDTQEFLTRSSPGRVAVVVNLGVHLHSMEDFADAYSMLWDGLDKVLHLNNTSSSTNNNRKPIVWFRNSSPGHKDCQPQGDPPIKQSPVWQQPIEETPYQNYQEWLPHNTNLYDWNLVPYFNQYAKRHLPAYAHYVNIFNMTVLRRDGHVGFGDCMHYYYPGPVDWWVHMWYSSLKDMAKEEEEALQRKRVVQAVY